ncbi:hypothetical protein LTR08_003758 [Meristemomyces frigidus]|nr:hypothetical protein LTR08_003758 [Meristemomyces frigidus]
MADLDSAKRSRVIENIEEKTMRQITITSNEYDAEGRFNEQEASPLFSLLPRELRDLIWALATAPFEDPNDKFENTAYYYRPGHTARLRTETALLLTCRRVFLEANAMPMLQAEHSFYYHRAAPDKRDPAWMAKLTEHNRQNFGHLHLYAQMYAIEDLRTTRGQLRAFFVKTPLVANDFQPRVLHVTVRHTDWWYWESENPLMLRDEWVKALLDTPDLRSTQTIQLELETLDYKVDQLEPILERIKGFKSKELETHLIDGKTMKTKFELTGIPETYSWEGPANIDKEQHSPYAGRDTLKYHVVTLTWKLRFPELPNAFVPELRRARISLPSTSTAGSMGDVPQEPFYEITPDTPSSRAFTAPRNPLDENRRSGRLTRAMRRRLITAEAPQPEEGTVRYERMRKAENMLQRHMKRQAGFIETRRRQPLQEWTARMEKEKWMRRWEGQKSLLGFVGEGRRV